MYKYIIQIETRKPNLRPQKSLASETEGMCYQMMSVVSRCRFESRLDSLFEFVQLENKRTVYPSIKKLKP